MKRRLVTISAAAIVVGLMVWLGVLGWRHYAGLPRNFSVVSPGILYRAGQGSGPQLRRAITRYHLKTLVCLRRVNEDANPRWFQEEQAVARELGVEFVHCPLTSDTLGDDAMWNRLLGLTLDPARRPVLVHCARGELRTGFFCALYRMVVDGWPREKALSEMAHFGYDLNGHPTAVEALKHFDVKRARTKLRVTSRPKTETGR